MREPLHDPSNTVADIVRADYRTAEVFKKYGINFCCSGEVSLETACSTRNLDCALIVHDLQQATRIIRLPNNLQYAKWNIGFLADYIRNVHHGYLYQAIPSLELILTSFISGHKKKYPQLQEIGDTFNELSRKLLQHIRHEDEIIFPYVQQIESALRRNESYGNLLVRTLRKPIGSIEREHEEISRLLKGLSASANNYQFPANACTNHQVIYHKLSEFHDDMVQHMYLENEILYPGVKQIEQRLLNE